MNSIMQKYADLLVNYCVELKRGEKLFVETTTVAEPLVIEIFRAATKAGAIVETNFIFKEYKSILLEGGDHSQLSYIPVLYQKAMQEFDAYLHIMAPFSYGSSEDRIPDEKFKIRQQAFAPVRKIYSERTATRALKRNLCQYPTEVNAAAANMSLQEYEQFVFNACKLYDVSPVDSWLEVRKVQQKIVDFLNKKSVFRYQNEKTDISFSTKGRTWINSDGQTNMPSGEVYTSPVEDSVNGVIHFSYPAIHNGMEINGVTLWVKDGWIEKWTAEQGIEALDHVFQLEGARRFGEAAIGTNYDIQRFTKNMLFDEKIGGTVHMAIGQSYFQTGGKNRSPIHWDMITDMKNDGQIWADDEKIYENGQFLLS